MSNAEQFLWVERYRPRTVEDCILPQAIKESAKSFVAQGDLPNMILSGGPGMGKTTLAMAMCRELGIVPMFINGSEESGIDVLRTKIKDYAAALSLDGKRRMIILDEADYLNQNSTQPALRGLIEEFAINCGFILTCNYTNRIIPALHSRCTTLSFAIPVAEKKKLMVKTVDRLEYILKAEGVSCAPELLIAAVKRWWPDTRRIINELQRAAVDKVVNASILGASTDVQFEPLYTALKARNYKEARTWIGQNADVDAPKFYRTVFEWLHDNVDASSLSALIILLADYQFRHLNAIDTHVHLAALCLEIMHNAVWK
jgi:DNA polymerase III delta prime subunit